MPRKPEEILRDLISYLSQAQETHRAASSSASVDRNRDRSPQSSNSPRSESHLAIVSVFRDKIVDFLKREVQLPVQAANLLELLEDRFPAFTIYKMKAKSNWTTVLGLPGDFCLFGKGDTQNEADERALAQFLSKSWADYVRPADNPLSLIAKTQTPEKRERLMSHESVEIGRDHRAAFADSRSRERRSPPFFDRRERSKPDTPQQGFAAPLFPELPKEGGGTSSSRQGGDRGWASPGHSSDSANTHSRMFAVPEGRERSSRWSPSRRDEKNPSPVSSGRERSPKRRKKSRWGESDDNGGSERERLSTRLGGSTSSTFVDRQHSSEDRTRSLLGDYRGDVEREVSTERPSFEAPDSLGNAMVLAVRQKLAEERQLHSAGSQRQENSVVDIFPLPVPSPFSSGLLGPEQPIIRDPDFTELRRRLREREEKFDMLRPGCSRAPQQFFEHSINNMVDTQGFSNTIPSGVVKHEFSPQKQSSMRAPLFPVVPPGLGILAEEPKLTPEEEELARLQQKALREMGVPLLSLNANGQQFVGESPQNLGPVLNPGFQATGASRKPLFDSAPGDSHVKVMHTPSVVEDYSQSPIAPPQCKPREPLFPDKPRNGPALRREQLTGNPRNSAGFPQGKDFFPNSGNPPPHGEMPRRNGPGPPIGQQVERRSRGSLLPNREFHHLKSDQPSRQALIGPATSLALSTDTGFTQAITAAIALATETRNAKIPLFPDWTPTSEVIGQLPEARGQTVEVRGQKGPLLSQPLLHPTGRAKSGLLEPTMSNMGGPMSNTPLLGPGPASYNPGPGGASGPYPAQALVDDHHHVVSANVIHQGMGMMQQQQTRPLLGSSPLDFAQDLARFPGQVTNGPMGGGVGQSHGPGLQYRGHVPSGPFNGPQIRGGSRSASAQSGGQRGVGKFGPLFPSRR